MGNLLYNSSNGHLYYHATGHLLYENRPPASCPWPAGGLVSSYNITFTGTLYIPSPYEGTLSGQTVLASNDSDCEWQGTVQAPEGTWFALELWLAVGRTWRLDVWYSRSTEGSHDGGVFIYSRKLVGATPLGAYSVYFRQEPSGVTNTLDDFVVSAS